MQEKVEIDLRNIIHKYSSPMQTHNLEDVEGLTIEEIMLMDKFPEEKRVINEKQFDQIVGAIQFYIKYGKKVK